MLVIGIIKKTKSDIKNIYNGFIYIIYSQYLQKHTVKSSKQIENQKTMNASNLSTIYIGQSTKCALNFTIAFHFLLICLAKKKL